MTLCRSRFFEALVVGFLLAVFAVLATGSHTRQSPTIDEPVHLLAGYSYLKWGDYRANPEHPPLAKLWAALPLLWIDVKHPIPSSSLWREIAESEPGGPIYPLAGQIFFKLNDADKLFRVARLQMLAVSLVLALLVYLWGREVFGIGAASVSLFAFALDPGVLAHAGIVHTDMFFAALVFASTWVFWRAVTHLTWANLSLTAVLFGLAAVTKHSFIAVLPIWLALACWKIFAREAQPSRFRGVSDVAPGVARKLLSAGALLAAAGAAAYIAVWAVYGFRFSAIPGGAPLFITDASSAPSPWLAGLLTFARAHHLMPEAWIAGMLYNLKIWEHASYLLGDISPDGFWSYFPVAFAVKTPLPTILLALGAAAALLVGKNGSRVGREPWLLFWTPVIIYFILAVLSRFNIGIRHLLPIYPFLFVLVGGCAWALWQSGSRGARSGLLIAALWHGGTTFFTHPHYLSYFNELAGGSKNGHKVLLDSNLDWGQDLKGLKRWLDEQGIARVQLAYFGTAEPSYYGIDDFFSSENLGRWPAAASSEINLPEVLAVSANFLYGGELFLPPELAGRMARYRERSPIASIGHSILLFKTSHDESQAYEDAAIIAQQRGAFAAAEALLQNALERNPSRAESRYQFAVLMSRRGRWERALREYRHALALDPRHGDAHLGLGNLLARAQQYDQAEGHYREAVKLRPHMAAGHLNLGRVLIARGRIDEAVEQLRMALRLEPERAEIHESLARALAARGEREEAAERYNAALRLLRQKRGGGARGP